MIHALGLAAVIVGSLSAVGLVLCGVSPVGAWTVAVCGVAVLAIAHRAPRWWP